MKMIETTEGKEVAHAMPMILGLLNSDDPEGMSKVKQILSAALMSVKSENFITEQEFHCVADSANGWIVCERDLGPCSFAGDPKPFWDGGGFLDDPWFAEKWGVNTKDLAYRLGKWTPMQRLALLSAVDGFFLNARTNRQQKKGKK